MLTQRRFLFDGEDDGTRWAIPVIVRQRHGDLTKEDRLLLDGDEAMVVLLDPEAFVVVNAGSHGFYRVAYDADLLARLTGPALDELSTPERYSLVDDTWSAVVAGALDATRSSASRRASRASASCPSGRCCSTGCAGAGGSSTATSGSASRPSSASWSRRRSTSSAGTGGPTTTTSRPSCGARRSAPWPCSGTTAPPRSAPAPCTRQAEADPASVDPEIAAAALGVVAATGTDADYERCLASYLNAPNPQEQQRYLFALAEFPEVNQMTRTLTFALRARRQDPGRAVPAAGLHRQP